MKRNNTIHTGIAAVIGAMVVIAAPATSSAHSLTRRDVCPAIDTEPLCGLSAQPHVPASGAGLEPAVLEKPVPSGIVEVDFDGSCSGTSIVRIRPCAA